MKTRALLAGLLLVASATYVLAAGPYISAAGGVSITHESDIKRSSLFGSRDDLGTAEYNSGYGLSVSAGYNIDPVRIEFEFGYKNADVDNVNSVVPVTAYSDITMMSYMANAYYDVKTSSAFTPYVGAGIGMLNGEFKAPGGNKNESQFGYQIIAGAAYNLNKNVAIDLSYRLLAAAFDFTVDGEDLSYMSSNIIAGLRYSF